MEVLRFLLTELRLFFSRPSWLSEAASGAATFGWGVLAINDTHATSWPSLDLMLRVSDSPVWGVLGIVLGIGQMGSFRMIDQKWHMPWLRWIGAILTAWIWAAVTISTAGYMPWPPTMAASAGWWGVNVYLIFRLFVVRG